MASKGNHKSVSQLQKITRKNDRRYSNDMKDAVATFCHECDKVMLLSGLEDHIESEHQLSISEYCKFYRKPDTQLIRITYHRCRLCEKSLVLDKDKIIHHLTKCHSETSFARYKGQFLIDEGQNLVPKAPTPASQRRGAPAKSTSSLVRLPNPPPSRSPTWTQSPLTQTPRLTPTLRPSPTPTPRPSSRRTPWPECSLCGRNFKSNMHLKMHIRHEHLL